MNNRIKEIRNFFKLTQEEFGKKIGSARNTIANYENGNRSPSNAIITSICREFNVNEDWLRTGQGEMFVQRTKNQIITDFAGDLINEPDSFKTRLIEGLAKLDKSDWEDIEELVTKLVNKKADE